MPYPEFKKWCGDKLQQWHVVAVDAPLYHYTTALGLDGIIKSRQLRLTSIFHLNDPSELGFGIRISLAMLRKELTCFGGRESVNYFARVLPRMLEDTPGDVHRYYVASLSKKRNDLGQWRAYADNGHGFMIGFAPELFQVSSNADNMNEKYFVVRVNYDRAQVASRHREVIRMALQAMRRAPQTEWRLITVEAALLLLIGSVLAKHQGYGIEDEIRLVLVNELRWVAPCIKTRARGTSLVPFVDCELLKYSSRPITEIMIGPTGKSNARDAVKQLLANQEATSPTGCPGPPVIRSLIPYQTP